MDLFQIIIYALLAVFGVSARELRYKDVRKIQMAKLISNAVVASFGATISYFVLSLTGVQPQLGYIMAGLVGWGGPQIIDKLFEKNVPIAEELAKAKATGNKKPHKKADQEPPDGHGEDAGNGI